MSISKITHILILLNYVYYIYHILLWNIRLTESSLASRPVHPPLLNMHETMLVSSHATCHLSKFCCYKNYSIENYLLYILPIQNFKLTCNMSPFKFCFTKIYSTEKTVHVLITNATSRAQLQHVTFQNTHF